MNRPARSILAATILAWIVASAIPAWAATVSISKVEECTTTSCTSTKAYDGTKGVKDRVFVDVSFSSSVGVTWLEVHARPGSTGAWTCLKTWTDVSGETSGTRDFQWNTKKWPTAGDCKDADIEDPTGALTSNGSYEIRVAARDAVEIKRATVARRINNPPTTPAWAADLVVTGADERDPMVELKWNASPEPDIKEYHFIRTDPNGPEREYWVSASKPGGQGCTLSGSTYTCYDDDFPSAGYGGSYGYSLVAYRSSPVSGDSCATGGDCVQSQVSSERTADVDEPAPSPTPSPDDTGTPDGTTTPTPTGSRPGFGGRATPSSSPPQVLSNRSSSGSNAEFYTGEFDRNLPYQGQTGFGSGSAGQLPGTFDGDETLASDNEPLDLPLNRRIWLFMASGLVMVLSAAHMARLLRDQ